jgi:hypothetical protein
VAGAEAGEEEAGGGGGGGGGGRGRRAVARDGQGFWTALKRISRGDVAPIVERIDRHIERVEEHLEEQGFQAHERAVARDVAVIAGVSLTMLGIKALKVLPNIPFAPGYKTVVLTPLYIVARLRTRSRVGATVTGFTMGLVAFLGGDGRYGPFEILKHTAPGVVCDLVGPVMVRGGRTPGARRVVAPGRAHRRRALRDHLRRDAHRAAAPPGVGAPGPGPRAAHDVRRAVGLGELAAGAGDAPDQGRPKRRPAAHGVVSKTAVESEAK